MLLGLWLLVVTVAMSGLLRLVDVQIVRVCCACVSCRGCVLNLDVGVVARSDDAKVIEVKAVEVIWQACALKKRSIAEGLEKRHGAPW